MPLLHVALALVAVAVIAMLIKTYVRIPTFVPIVTLVLGLLLVGILLWVINTYVPMAESIKAILNIVVVLATCVWVLQVVGLWSEVVRVWNRVTRHTPTTGI
jgi:predicted membrane protein